jgi:hypothetical protein
VSVVKKSDDYDDGNWHAKQPKQYRAAHERLLFCFRFESRRLLNGQAIGFVPLKISPSLECSLDLLQEGRPLLSGGMIHIVIGKVVAAHGVAWH